MSAIAEFRSLAAYGPIEIGRARHPELGDVLVERLHGLGPEAVPPPGGFEGPWRGGGALASQLVEPLAAGHDPAGGVWVASRDPGGACLPEIVAVRGGGPLPIADTTRLLGSLVDILLPLHEAGWFHGEIFPEDLFVDGEGKLRLAGFGRVLVKRLARERSAGGEAKASLKEALGRVHPYLAPERVLHPGSHGSASDVYALGAIGYRLLTDENPFAGETREELAEAVMGAPPFVPSSIAGEVPAGLDRVILKCLEKTPGDRFPGAAFVKRALDLVAAGEDPGIKLVGRVRYREWPWALRMVLLILFLEIAYLVIKRPEVLENFGAQVKLLLGLG